MSASDTQLMQALSGISMGLEADGYAVDAHWSDAGQVEINVSATPDACADCLVPSEIMRQMALTMLGNSGVSVGLDDIVVTYPEGSASH